MANYSVPGLVDTLVSASTANDNVTVSGSSYSTIQGGDGVDKIYGMFGSNFNRYEGGKGNDNIYVSYDNLKDKSYNSIVGGNGNTINGGEGNDIIYLGGFNANIGGVDARDYNTVIEFSNDDGEDTIVDTLVGGSDYTIKLTAGKFASTAVASNGNDVIITVDPSVASTTSNTGKITIKGGAAASFEFVADGELFVSRNNDNKAKKTITDSDGMQYGNKTTLVGGGTDVLINNIGDHVSIGGNFAAAYNYGANVSVTGGKTAIKVENRGVSAVVKGGSKDDVLYNYNDGGNINGNAGNDEIVNYQGHKSSLFGAAGNDTISVAGGRAVTVSGDAGNDDIYDAGKGTVIIGGAGNDNITLASGRSTVKGEGALIQYATGMGLDVIEGLTTNDTLHITKGNITDAQADGDDLVLHVANAKNTITIKDGAKAGTKINLKVGTYETMTVESDTLTASALKQSKWTITNGTAVLGSPAKPIAQITGLNTSIDWTKKDINDYLSVPAKAGQVITVKKSALASSGTATLTTGNYKLALFTASDSSTDAEKAEAPDASKTTAGSWSVVNGVAIYNAAVVTEGYSVASTKKSITYNAASEHGGEPTAVVTGLNPKATAKTITMDESTGVITLAKGAMPTGTDSTNIRLINTLTDAPYTLALAKGIAEYKETDAGWVMSGTTAKYNSGTSTAGFILSDDALSVTYNTTTTKATTLATLTGLKKGTKASSVFVNNGTILMTQDLLGTTNVALTGTTGWKLALADDIVAPTIALQPTWEYVKNKGYAYVTAKIATTGYTLSGNNITYSKAGSGAVKTFYINGLNEGLDIVGSTKEKEGTLEGVNYDVTSNKVTISQDVIDTDNAKGIVITGTVTEGAEFEVLDADGGNAVDVMLTNSTKVATALTGNDGNDTIKGGAGADTLTGGAGDDSLLGGAGDDILYGGASGSDGDVLSGDAGNDTLYSGTGTGKTLSGGAGNDYLKGENTDEEGATIAIEEVTVGKKTVDSVVSDVFLSGGAGNDTLVAGAGGGLLLGEAGNDSLVGDEGDDYLDGGAGNDTLKGGAGKDSLISSAGLNHMEGGAGDDELTGGSGADYMDGGADNDTLTGNAGNDTMYGGKGDDELTSSAGNNYMDGGEGADKLTGGSGKDTLLGDAGDDELSGGAGNDSLDGGAGADKLYGGAGNDTILAGAGNDIIYGYQELEYDEDDDSKEAKAERTAANKDGADLIHANEGNDTVYGGAGNDTIYADSGNNELYGGAGVDVLYAGTGTDVLEGEDGNDKLYAGTGSATLLGGAGNDSLFGDTINGSSVALLEGGAGVDQLYGGAGSVTMTGGDGADNFYYATTYGDNYITDYTYSTAKGGTKDVIKLSDFSAASSDLSVSKYGSTDTGVHVVLQLGDSTKSLDIQIADGTDSISVSGINAKKKADSKIINLATVPGGAVDSTSSSLFAEDNFITADNLSQIVETSSVGDFELNTDPGKLQAENLITYAEK